MRTGSGGGRPILGVSKNGTPIGKTRTLKNNIQTLHIRRKDMSNPMAKDVTDHEARGMAVSALQAIQSHERLCLERAKNAEAQRDRVEMKINTIMAAQTKQLWAVISVLAAALAFFLIPYFRLHT